MVVENSGGCRGFFRVKIMVDMIVIIKVLPSEDMRALVGVKPMY